MTTTSVATEDDGDADELIRGDGFGNGAFAES
jgi:hypothetical protein